MEIFEIHEVLRDINNVYKVYSFPRLMKVTVFIERMNKKIDIDAFSISDIFKKINIDQNTVLVTRNNELLIENDELCENDEIKLLSVISGG